MELCCISGYWIWFKVSNLSADISAESGPQGEVTGAQLAISCVSWVTLGKMAIEKQVGEHPL